MNNCRQPFRFLVVDDDPISREVLTEHLEAAGHEVVSADSVAGALSVLERERVQMVVADWIMPHASGLDLCRWVRKQKWGATVHFVILTVLSDKARLIEAFGAGVDDFLSKPLHEGELFARLNAWGRMVSLQQELAQRHAEAVDANAALRAANAKLADLAIRDELTGLANRREALRRLGEQWAIAARYTQPLSCAIIDVDRFKEVNDTHGHRAGDELLKQLAARLRECLRECDGIFRIGGDEFLALLPVAGLDEALEWSRRCQHAVSSRPVHVNGKELTLTVSVGVAQRDPDMQVWAEMVEAADQALLESKRRDHVDFSNPARLLTQS